LATEEVAEKLSLIIGYYHTFPLAMNINVYLE